MAYDDFEPNRLAHMELIQGAVSRLAGNAFVIKGWAITVAGVFFGFALTSHSARLALAAAIPIVAFWALDSYYLRAERLFRVLYDEVRLKDERIAPFAMGATGSSFVSRVRSKNTASGSTTAASRFRAATSVTVLPLYLGLLFAALLVAATIHQTDDPRSTEPSQASSHAARMR